MTKVTTIVEKAFGMLGHTGKDVVTGFEGTIDSICFDLYGCVQIALNPGMDKENKKKDSYWFDVKRIGISGATVLDPPKYLEIEAGKEIGAADKPTQRA